MKAKFINWCEIYFNGVANFVQRVMLAASCLVALFTIGNVICPLY